MPVPVPQISFAGGILSPAAYSRIDLQKFGTAAKELTNYFTHAEGGISNRTGSEYVRETKNSSNIARLVTFEFNEEQAYALEFGNLYIRVMKEGALVLESGFTISGATQANPVVITATGSNFTDGKEIYISGVVGMTELNGKYFTVANATANTCELSGIDGTGYTTYSSAGTAAQVHEITTPYLSSELATLKFRQSNDVIYLTHRNHAPRELSRTGHAAWTLTEIEFTPEQVFPTALTVSPGTPASTTYRYKVTAVNEDTAEESLVGTGTTQVISGATQADPVVLTVTGHPFSDGDEVHISGIVGMTELNGRRFTVANQATNSIELKGEDGTGHTAYSSVGSADRTHVITTTGNATADNTITIPETVGAGSFNIYKEDNGLYGFIGRTETNTFLDGNIAADLNDTSPKLRQPFITADNYPGAIGLHEQRSVWGNTTNNPLHTYLSQTGQYNNLNVSSPTKDTDAVTFRLVTGKGNEIRHYRSFDDQLFVFTSGAVWQVRPGGDTDAITSSSKKVSVSAYLSSTDVPPITIKENILMVAGQANVGFEVHSLGYNLEKDGYAGSDLTVLARHLFEGYTLSEWAFIERPYRLLVAVRSDGKLIAMTYLQEHQVFAWSVWETDGIYESVCSVPEGQEDFLYMIVKRTIDGNEVRYNERLHTRQFTEVQDAFFVDSGISYEAPAIAITGATQANPVVITAVGHPFSNGEDVRIEDVVGMTELNKNHFTVANSTANTFELTGEDGTGHTAYNSGGNSYLQLSTLTNVDHLEGKTVLALVNGNIEDGLTVSGGSVTLANPGRRIHLGLSYEGSFETLPINPDPATIDKKKIVKSVSLRVLKTRGIYAGPNADNLEEYPARSTELWGDPAALKSDIIKVPITGDWESDTGVYVKSEPGLPQTISSLVANTNVGG